MNIEKERLSAESRLQYTQAVIDVIYLGEADIIANSGNQTEKDYFSIWDPDNKE